MIAQRLRWANRRRVDYLAHDAATRVVRVLVELVETYGRQVPDGWDLGVELTQSEIASIAGVKLATAKKILHALDQDGLVKRGYRDLRVADLVRMRQVAEMPAENPY
jgi:CRP/FNR family transcriptional regulator, cyclic AMP receptor protein